MWSKRYKLQSLKNPCYALTSTNTSGDHSIFLIAALHLVQQLNGEFGSCTTQGMAHGYGSSVDVDRIGIQTSYLDDSQGLSGKCFVELCLLNIGQLESRLMQCFGNGFAWADSHIEGINPPNRTGGHPGLGF